MKKYDICIVGGGIVGLAHTLHAAQKGLKVVHFERNQFALGASVRNFGLVWPIGQRTETYNRAMRSKEVWLEMSRKSGFHVKQNGSLHLAYHEDEMNVLQEFVSNGQSYNSTLLSIESIKKDYSHINPTNLLGGLYSASEMTVDPREAIKKISEYLSSLENVDMHFGQTVTGVNMPVVSTFEMDVAVDHLVICSGADFETLYPNQLKVNGLTKCKLQMMRTQPVDFELGPTLCAGLTLTHYDAFEGCNSLIEVRNRFEQTMPEFRRNGIHVLLAQNELGELIIGDSHHYNEDFYPFDDLSVDQLILEYLSTFFLGKFEIKEKWHGIYAKQSNGDTDVVLHPEKNVTLVNGLGGAGMTLSFGLAEEVISAL